MKQNNKKTGSNAGNVNIVTRQSAGPVIDKQAAMQQSVDRNSYETGLVQRPFSDTSIIKSRYRGGQKQPLPRKSLDLAKMVVSGTAELTEAEKPASVAAISASDMASLAGSAAKQHLLFKSLTYATVDIGEHLIFAKSDAYGGIIGTYTANDEALVTEMAAGKNEKHHPSEIKLARLAIGLKDAAISQSNSHNPAYAMNIAEIYDRMVDYFRAVSLALVLYYNSIGFFGSESKFKLGARGLWTKSTFRDIFEPTMKLNFADKIADLRRAILGQYYLDFSLVDYLDFAVVSLLPNQDAGFRYLVPRLHDHQAENIEYVYTGAQLFLADDTAENKYTAFRAGVDSVIEYFASPTAKLLAAMATGFNQFPMLTSLPTEYELRLSSRLIQDMEDNSVAYFGFNTIHTLADDKANVIVPFTSNAASVGGIMAIKRTFGGDPKLIVLQAAEPTNPDYSVVYPDTLSIDDPMSDAIITVVGTGYKQFKERTDASGKTYAYTNVNTAAGLRRAVHDAAYTYLLGKPYTLGLTLGTPHRGLDERPNVSGPTIAQFMSSAALGSKLGVYSYNHVLYFGGDIDEPFSINSDALFGTSSTSGGSANVQMSGEVTMAKWYLYVSMQSAIGLVITRLGNILTTPGTSYLSMSVALGMANWWVLPYVVDFEGHLRFSKSDDLFKVDWVHAKFFNDRINVID